MGDKPNASTKQTKIADLLTRIRDAHPSSSLRRLNNALCVIDTELDALTARISAALGDKAATTAAKDTATAEQTAVPLSTEPPAMETTPAVATAAPIMSRAEATTTPSAKPAPAPVVSSGVAIGGEKTDDVTQKAAAPVPWEEFTRRLLEKANEAAKRRDFERGWRCLKAADRFMLYGLSQVDPKALEAKAKAIVAEAEDTNKGLPDWRKASIKYLLCDEDGDLRDPVDIDRLVDAKRLLDDHQDNVYQRLSILKSRLDLLSAFGVALLVVWWIVAPPVPLELTVNSPLAALSGDSRQFWFMITLAGILGGLLSAFTSAIGNDIKKSNIPAELANQTVTRARLVVSALSPLAVLFFLGSGIITFPQVNNAFVVTIAIASGFTDRLLLRAIEQLAKPK